MTKDQIKKMLDEINILFEHLMVDGWEEKYPIVKLVNQLLQQNEILKKGLEHILKHYENVSPSLGMQFSATFRRAQEALKRYDELEEG